MFWGQGSQADAPETYQELIYLAVFKPAQNPVAVQRGQSRQR